MNENQKVTKPSKLEQLTPEQQQWILETALHMHLVDMVRVLRKEGISTSPASLSRFIKKDRERRILEDREESAPALEALAEAGRDGKLREGTLEAVRQRLYERALVSQSPEEAMELYAAMVKEEARLKELELEARKVAALEQQVKLQAVRIEVERAKAATSRRGVKGEVVDLRGEVVDGKQERAKLELGGPGAAGLEPGKERLLLVLREVNEVLNRAGSTEEKVLVLRARLAAEKMDDRETKVTADHSGNTD